MYAIFDDDLRAVCVVTDEGEGVLELKNLAVSPAHQKKGYGRAMLEFLQKEYRGKFHTLQLGTGDSPLTVPFYEKCGFIRSHVVKNFFTDNYDHPIIECGILLQDMVYFKKEL
ncbi:MAG: GNAT family N-acetyltransferase [Clostridia bacterium]|nr:GNAT family N-acetyltransferase [Clostridia bacterium]